MAKTYQEINEKISKGEAVVLTAEEVTQLAEKISPAEIADKVDVVTTATFGPMCSSGAFINFGHPDPPMRMEHITLNGVEAYGGIAAADAYIGATQESKDDPSYGGAHVIQSLIAGDDIELKAEGKGTDCYPRKELKAIINRETVNEMILHNPRNAYQNYPAATNTTEEKKYTYMGILKPKCGNVTYSTSGELSPLLNDPYLKTIGIGTRIFLGGAQGFVTWNGTQFRTDSERNEFGVPIQNSATLTVTGNMKEMSTEFIRAAYYITYGVSMFIGIGIPIPILNDDIAKAVTINNSQIYTNIKDYGSPGMPVLRTVSYEELQSGFVQLYDKRVPTAPMSSIKKARQIAEILKENIVKGKFYLNQPVQHFPENTSLNSLKADN